uniref:Uncharacterized protein n=1 Tax=Gasterosteus aculeatus TaxID=69293 RepID=G3N9Y1_GASAC
MRYSGPFACVFKLFYYNTHKHLVLVLPFLMLVLFDIKCNRSCSLLLSQPLKHIFKCKLRAAMDGSSLLCTRRQSGQTTTNAAKNACGRRTKRPRVSNGSERRWEGIFVKSIVNIIKFLSLFI